MDSVEDVGEDEGEDQESPSSQEENSDGARGGTVEDVGEDEGEDQESRLKELTLSSIDCKSASVRTASGSRDCSWRSSPFETTHAGPVTRPANLTNSRPLILSHRCSELVQIKR